MGGSRGVLQVLVCLSAALLAAAAEEACPARAGGCAAAGAGGEYLWPHGRGHPRYYGQSPFTFGSPQCNLSASLKWSWQHPSGRYFTTIIGKPVVDDEVNIYISTEDSVRKFSPDGTLLWTWLAPDFRHLFREIPNNPAIMNGLLYNCLTTGEVFALDMRSGTLVWMEKVSDRGIGTDTAFTIARDGVVLLDVDQPTAPNIPNKVVALNGTNGRLLWEFRPDTGVWNFLPLFPGDGSFVFQSWSGSAYRVNLTDGKLLWRAGTLPGDVKWTDGGAALGSNGIFYTVSSTGQHHEASASSGGGLHAFRVSDGSLVWEKTDFDQGIYTYPVVGRLSPALALLFFVIHALTLKKEFRYSVQAFEAETGRLQWRLELPTWRHHAAAGDAEGVFTRMANWRRMLCLPLASSYPTLDAQGALFIGHFDGKLYQIKDWNSDGHIDPEEEVCSFEAGSAFFTGGPTLVPGLLLVASCDTLYAFAQ